MIETAGLVYQSEYSEVLAHQIKWEEEPLQAFKILKVGVSSLANPLIAMLIIVSTTACQETK
jgi:hypothetical protein